MNPLDKAALDRLEQAALGALVTAARSGNATAAAKALKAIETFRERDPTCKSAVIQYMRDTGRGYKGTAIDLRPDGMDDLAFTRFTARCKVWQRWARSRDLLKPAPKQHPHNTGSHAAIAKRTRASLVEHVSDATVAEMHEDAFYAHMLAGLQGDLDRARKVGEIRLVARLNSEMRLTREALERARGPTGRVNLNRDPRSVAQAIKRLAPAIATLAGMPAPFDTIDAEEA